MLSGKNHRSVLNKARRRRNRNQKKMVLMIGMAVIAAAILIFGLIRLWDGRDAGPAPVSETEAQTEPAVDEAASRAAEEEAKRQQEEAEKQAVVDSYENLGMVQVSGYLNVRKTPASDGDIIGKMQENSACEILGQEEGWYHIKSGDVEGYISGEFVVTGEEARALALENVKLRAIVHVEKSLNIRQTPEQTDSNIVAQALNNERYEVIGQQDGWIQIPSGYISAEYAEVRYALNEARKMDLKAMAINQYDHLLISKVSNYLNIRKTPENLGDENIIGKLPGNAAGDIIETTDGWYKIRSGKITGYVSADPAYTAVGQEAIDLAMEQASLMAIVNTDKLNVRKEPNTDSGVWTQISKEERYPVIQQMDGWVQIELDAGDGESSDAAYISTRDNNVEVRYALNEAIGQVVHAASRRSGIKISTWNYRSPARIRNVID